MKTTLKRIVSDEELEYYASLVDTLAELAVIPYKLEDWRDIRGQGSRQGKSVLGAMADPPRGVKKYLDYRNAEGVTEEIWKELRILISTGYEIEGKAVIGAIQGGLDIDEAMLIGYSRVD